MILLPKFRASYEVEPMKTLFILLFMMVLLVLGLIGGPAMANDHTSRGEAGSLGKITVGTDVSEWNVGSGQENGEFAVSELQGIELGLRAQERFVGPLEVTGDQGNRVGVYEASTGSTGGDNNGTWNYDWHVDLSDAKGNAKGKTLDDYRLVLEQDFTEQSLFGVLGSDPVELPLAPEPPVGAGTCSNHTVSSTLCQQSWNPGFGNTDYDPLEERPYNLRLVLTLETFNGPPMAVVIRVNVTE